MFTVENDNLSDDWPGFHTRKEALGWIREQCAEIAAANVDTNGLGNCPAFQGMTKAAITDKLYRENRNSIECR